MPYCEQSRPPFGARPGLRTYLLMDRGRGPLKPSCLALANTIRPRFCSSVRCLRCAGLAAALIPARRAASIDPMQALRTE
jgi:hypothetical protein